MTHLFRAVAAIVALALLAGCSTHRMAERTRLPLHPIHETRMTNQAAPGYVPTGVWRVRGASNTVYLVGTSHLVANDEIPFPSSYYAAYRDSEEVLVEVDSLSFSASWMVISTVPGALRFLLKHASEFTCPKGRTLADYVSLETARQLRKHYGNDYATKEHLTPLGLVFFNELSGDVAGAEGGVDDLFTLLAHRDGKRIRSLDDRHAAKLLVPILDAMFTQTREEIASRGVDAVVQEAILEQEKERDGWRYGDVSAAAEDIAEMKRDVPELYEQLLPGRNRRWLPVIQRALAGKRNVMVLVGALHLPGDGGLLQLLRAAGFQPEQMHGIDRPARASAAVTPR
jgi:uncharacterized protein